MWNPRGLKIIQEIQRLNRLLRTLRHVREITDKKRRDEAVLKWMRENRSEFEDLPEEKQSAVRETCEYDEVEWARLLSQLNQPRNEDAE